MSGREERLPKEVQQKQDASAPEIPHRAQKGGRQREIEDSAAGGSQQHIAPQLSLGLVQYE